MTDLLVAGAVTTQDPARPHAEAVAIAGGRVAAIGDLASVRAQARPGTPVLEVPYVAPGFVDSHVHLLWAGRRAERLVLDDATGVAEVLERIRGYAAAHPEASWLEADAGFDAPLPTAAQLEAAAPGVGLVLDRKGHDALVNMTALRRAGIGPDTADPDGGRIERAADGTPTGLLVERPAVALVRAVVPVPGAVIRARWIQAGQRELLRHGITTVVDPAVDAPGLAAYAEAARDRRLRMRIVAMPLAGLTGAQTGVLAGADPDRLRRGPAKVFLDGGGSLGTALLSQPWPGTDGYHGQQACPTEELRAYCAAAAAAGRGVGVHAVGDAAVELVLDVLAGIDRRHPVAGLGFHLIHAYLGPSRAAMARARDLGVGLSAQPALQWQVGAGLADRLGERRAGQANPLRAWLDAGVRVGGGSDGPGPPMSVLAGMWQARTRKVRGRSAPLGAAQAVTAAEALDLFTVGAAGIAGGPGTGRLRVGDPGDLVALDVDPLCADADELAAGRILATVVGGAVEYAR